MIMEHDTVDFTMNRNKPLSIDEWRRFLYEYVQLPSVAEQEVEKLTEKLATYSKNVDDFLELTERQLVKVAHICVCCNS